MNGAAKKILLVEDEPSAKLLYQNRLQSEGFDVSIAADGEGALSDLCKQPADLVVLDLMLPRVNGEQAVKQIRSNDRMKAMPVLVISNAYMTEMSQKALESGATRGLFKTECTPARLVETVRDLLGFRSAFDLTNSPASDDKQIEAFADAAEKALEDEIKLKETREEFVKKAPSEITKIREVCRAYVKAVATPGASESLGQLYQQVRFFATRAGLSGCVRIAFVASAFEALLFDVLFKPARATPSVAQTFSQAVDCLERLCQSKDGGVGEAIPRAKILVVDDDAVCNLAMVSALKRAQFEPVSVEDSTKVLSMASASRFDVILLDVNMPGMNGFELCKGLRSMPQYKETPVIFITANADFQNRAQSILSGGNDLIPKPVSPLELVLKTTMRLVQPKGAPAGAPQAQRLPAKESPANPIKETPPIPMPQNVTEPVKLTSSPAEQAAAPAAKKAESSFSTEMIKKAWSAGSIEPSGPEVNEKAPEGGETKGAVTIPALKVEEVLPPKTEELPKIETPTAKETDGKTVAAEAEAVKLDPDAISIGTLKMAETEPPKHVNGVDKSEDLNQTQSKIELPGTGVSPAAPEPATQPEAPPAAVAEPKAEQAPVLPDPKPQHTTPTMDTTKKPTLDEAARGVARIIFGDENITDMNVRLTRIALERYNVPGTQKLDDVARGVSQIIFGDDKVSEMNVRLTRIALESYNVGDLLHLNGSNGVPANGAAH